MSLFAAPQTHINPYFIPILQKLCDLFSAHEEIVRACGKSDPHAFDLNLLLFLAVLALSFLALVLELAEIHDSAYRRSSGRRDLNEIKPLLLRYTERLGRFQNAEILAVRSDDADRRGTDPLIDTVSSLDGIIFNYLNLRVWRWRESNPRPKIIARAIATGVAEIVVPERK